MRCLAIAAFGLTAILSGCGNSIDIPSEPRSAGAESWRPVWADSASAQLRPGSTISAAQRTGWCTANFLFVNPVTETYYIGTAAHCFDSPDGKTRDGTGTRVELENFGEIGTVVFDSDIPQNVGSTYELSDADFILIQLDPGINLIANPEMMSFLGPTGFVTCSETLSGDTLGFYGDGLVAQQSDMQARQGVLTACDDSQGFRSVIGTSEGDSGGPVLHLATGRALGTLTGTQPPFGTIGGSMAAIFAELSEAGFGSAALATIDGNYAAPASN